VETTLFQIPMNNMRLLLKNILPVSIELNGLGIIVTGNSQLLNFRSLSAVERYLKQIISLAPFTDNGVIEARHIYEGIIRDSNWCTVFGSMVPAMERVSVMEEGKNCIFVSNYRHVTMETIL
jgi:hypothetical protein